MWANDGRELFYVTRAGGMMKRPNSGAMGGGVFAMGAPTRLFEGRYYFWRQLDFRPNLRRPPHVTAGFLLMKSVSERMQSATEIEVVPETGSRS